MIKKVKARVNRFTRLGILLIVLGLHPAVASVAAQAETMQAEIPKISPLEQTFYNSGKIYVVVAVALVILIGIFVYLIRTERRIIRLEKEFNQRSK
jgi:CcmD family protein